MITPKDDKAASLYVNLMAEIRDRLNAIARSQNPDISVPMFGPDYLAVEFAMLQLRMICELIAFACLVAHGDVPETRTTKFRGDYSAKVIFGKLAKFHPDFFPTAVSRIRLSSGQLDIQNREGGWLGKDELERLYTYCLEHLHRGRVEQILAGTKRLYDTNYLIESCERLGWLLDTHVIFLVSGRKMLVEMDRDGKVVQEWMLPIPPPNDNARRGE